MGEVVKFESHNPNSWTVEDALKRALENVQSGKFDATKVYVALCKDPTEGNSGQLFYTMAGMRLAEALGWLSLHKNMLMSEED